MSQLRDHKVVTRNPDQTQLTTWYTERAVRFIDNSKDRPFFLYVAHNMPHVPLHVSVFDLEKDVAEMTNVADKHPEIVEKLKALAEKAREELGDSAMKRVGIGVRPAGQIMENPK